MTQIDSSDPFAIASEIMVIFSAIVSIRDTITEALVYVPVLGLFSQLLEHACLYDFLNDSHSLPQHHCKPCPEVQNKQLGL